MFPFCPHTSITKFPQLELSLFSSCPSHAKILPLPIQQLQPCESSFLIQQIHAYQVHSPLASISSSICFISSDDTGTLGKFRRFPRLGDQILHLYTTRCRGPRGGCPGTSSRLIRFPRSGDQTIHLYTTRGRGPRMELKCASTGCTADGCSIVVMI